MYEVTKLTTRHYPMLKLIMTTAIPLTSLDPFNLSVPASKTTVCLQSPVGKRCLGETLVFTVRIPRNNSCGTTQNSLVLRQVVSTPTSGTSEDSVLLVLLSVCSIFVTILSESLRKKYSRQLTF